MSDQVHFPPLRRKRVGHPLKAKALGIWNSTPQASWVLGLSPSTPTHTPLQSPLQDLVIQGAQCGLASRSSTSPLLAPQRTGLTPRGRSTPSRLETGPQLGSAGSHFSATSTHTAALAGICAPEEPEPGSHRRWGQGGPGEPQPPAGLRLSYGNDPSPLAGPEQVPCSPVFSPLSFSSRKPSFSASYPSGTGGDERAVRPGRRAWAGSPPRPNGLQFHIKYS